MNSDEMKVDHSSFQWNPKVLDEHLAPAISKFTSANILSIEEKHPESKYWIQNHFLNSALTRSYKKEIRPTLIQCLRRASAAFRYYHEAKKFTEEYLSGNDIHRPKSRAYYQAVDCWEAFFLQSQIFIDAYNRIVDYTKTGSKAFQKNDGSKEQRLYDIANCIKHGSSPQEAEQWSDSWTPLWLANDGFKSFKYSLTFKEACEILDEIARWANNMQNPSAPE
jgi:hypothetical protein